jgi:hypothetical protein
VRRVRAPGGEHEIDIGDELAARAAARHRDRDGLGHRHVVDGNPLFELVQRRGVSARAQGARDEKTAEKTTENCAHASQQCSQRAAEKRRGIAYFRSAAASAA